MKFIQHIRNLTRQRHRSVMLVCVLVTLTAASPFLAHKLLIYSFDRIDERAEQAELDAIAQRQDYREQQEKARHERFTNPVSGVTLEQIEAVTIGMTADEVELAIKYGYDLGIGGFPFSHRHNDLYWTADEIAVKGVGHIQAVFISKQLVGLGSLDPGVGRLCGGCLNDMLRGERDWIDGLPYQADGSCPICGSQKVIQTHAELGDPSNGYWVNRKNSLLIQYD